MMSNFLKLLQSDIMDLDAIWLSQPTKVYRNNKIVKTSRILENDLISVENNKIISSDKFTHKIFKCRGTAISSKLQIIATTIDYKTFQLINIK